MRWGLLVGTCACNQVYDLAPTQLPPPDAPFACPPIGAPAPEFSKDVFQVSTQRLVSYHFDATGTLAVGHSGFETLVGTIGEPLVSEPSIAPGPGYFHLDPHPSPAGDRIYLTEVFDALVAFGGAAIIAYDRTATGWQRAETLPAAITGHPSTVFRGPTGDRIIFVGSTVVDEYERDGTTWVRRGQHDRAALRIDAGTTLAVTTDGLRAVFRGDGNNQMYWTDRPDLDSWFGPAKHLVGVPKVADAQLTDDCARIYYSGLESAFYSQQK